MADYVVCWWRTPFPWCRVQYRIAVPSAPAMSHRSDCYFVVVPLSISKNGYSTMSTVGLSQVAGTALCCDCGFLLARRLMPLVHLCADATVERKRAEGEFMLY